MFNSSSIYSESWCRTVFANRNQAYGAYQLRKVSERNTIMGLLLTTTMVTGVAMYVTMKSHGSPISPQISELLTSPTDTMITVVMNNPEDAAPPADPALAEPPAAPEPMEIEPQQKDNIDNANIVIEKDSKVRETDKAPVTNVASTSTSTSSTTSIPTETITGKGITGGGSGEGEVVGKGKDFFERVEVMPEFPGGTNALMRYISSNTTYPESAKTIEKEGTVYVTFIVERTGEVSNVKVERSIFKPIDNEAIRVVKSMPTWKPGMQNGKAVRVQFTVPIRFLLS